MENTINRKVYRRRDNNVKITKNIGQPKKNIFINQIINALLILLFVLLLKFFELENYYNKIKEVFFSGLEYETIEKSVKNKYYELIK